MATYRSSFARAWLSGWPFLATCFSYSWAAAKAAAPLRSSWERSALCLVTWANDIRRGVSNSRIEGGEVQNRKPGTRRTRGGIIP